MGSFIVEWHTRSNLQDWFCSISDGSPACYEKDANNKIVALLGNPKCDFQTRVGNRNYTNPSLYCSYSGIEIISRKRLCSHFHRGLRIEGYKLNLIT